MKKTPKKKKNHKKGGSSIPPKERDLVSCRRVVLTDKKTKDKLVMEYPIINFKKKKIQRRQNDQDSRCHQYDLALQRVAPDPVLVCSDIAPDEKADASRNN